MVFKRKLLSSSVALAIAGHVAPLMAEEEMGAQNATHGRGRRKGHPR